MSDSEVLTRKSVGNNTPTSRSRTFALTLWDNDALEKLKSMKSDYLAYAPETCPDTGKFHWQCYIHLKTQHYLSAMMKRFNNNRVRVARGTAMHNRTYIFGPYSKDGKDKPANPDAIEVGTIPEQGKRNDLQEFRQAIREGKRGRELDEDHLPIIAKYPKLENRLVYNEDKERAINLFENGGSPEVHIRWGEPGTGKTRYVYDKHGSRNVFRPRLNRKSGQVWWNGYEGENVILLDEFDGQMCWTDLLNLIDRYPYQFETKGGMCWRLATHIYLTSNKPPEMWYPAEQVAALLRRVTTVTEVI